ncbi:MAG TPA: D-glycerate dehydrogenase [Amaricoccus sp.]|nr:D-glycerate dehydrogenase [Amaricoccus sp.]
MASARTRVVVTRRLPAPVEARMQELFDVTLNADDRPLSSQEIARAMAEADVLVPTITDRIGAGQLAQAGPQLRLIANYGAGFDHIDVETALERGIMVSNTPGVLAEDTADMAMAMILAVPRRMPEGALMMQRGEWEGWSPTALMGHRIRGKNLGILGLGRIGRAIARRALAFGLSTHYHNRRRVHPDVEAELGATWWESLDQMLARVDILTVNVPHTPSTFHLMNARRLKLMKPTAYIVNTARGEVIDENALTRMLRAGELAGAGLDVYERGRDVNPRLRDLPNVLLLPHMGSATFEGRLEMGEKVIINIKTFADGHRPPDQVVPAML